MGAYPDKYGMSYIPITWFNLMSLSPTLLLCSEPSIATIWHFMLLWFLHIKHTWNTTHIHGITFKYTAWLLKMTPQASSFQYIIQLLVMYDIYLNSSAWRWIIMMDVTFSPYWLSSVFLRYTRTCSLNADQKICHSMRVAQETHRKWFYAHRNQSYLFKFWELVCKMS